jgi:hypothetical protein
MPARDIVAKRIPGSYGVDSEAATVKTYTNPVLLYVTTAGTFSFTTLAGTARTSVALPVGLYPVAITTISAIADSGVAEAIYQ